MHRFINFKGFADAQINLFQPMTLLIGKNGSGKSNAIEGVELLAQIAHGRPLYEISDVGRGGAFEIRGGLAGCVRQGHDVMTLRFDYTYPFAGPRLAPCSYAVTIRARPEPRIAAETLTVADRPIFATIEGTEELTSGLLKVRYDKCRRGVCRRLPPGQRARAR